MILVDITQTLLLSVIGFFIAYVFILSVLAFFARSKSDFKTEKQRRFAIVIPAHNEEIMIAQTLYSVFAMIYPQSLYEVFVVADNCTDKTAAIARDIGATVLERSHETDRGKGYALRHGFGHILDQNKFDGVVVFDADSQVSGNFLTVMNYYMEQGSEVLQSSDLVQPQPEVWSSEMTRIGFTLYNLVRPLGRNALNLSMGLRGNGMCFAADVLKEVPWQAYSLTEDIEYGIILMLKGYKIQFAPEAKVVAKMPEQTKNAESQRERWEIGRYPIMARYSFPLLKHALTKRSLSYFDTFVDLVMPPMVNLLLVINLMFIINMVLFIFGFSQFGVYSLWWGGIFLMAIAHLLIGFKATDADKNLYRALAHVPKYAFWKLLLYIKAFVRGKQEGWVRTTRDSNAT